jgi:hypothetical protein
MTTNTDVIAKPSPGRAGIAVNMTLDVEARDALRQLCPKGKRATGRLMSRLIYEHLARLEERQRMRTLLDEPKEL